MGSKAKTFNQKCEVSFDEEHWQKINFNTASFERNFNSGKVNYRNMELEKQRAFNLSNKSLLHLEKLLVDFETHFTENGGKVLWARDADDACEMILKMLIQKKAIKVVRSHSTILDEIGLNEFLRKKNIGIVESNMSRFILQEAEMKSYHPTSPAIHLSKEEMNDILSRNFKLKPDSTPKQMVNFIRYMVDEDEKDCDVCLTGANFLLSDEGGVVLTENEGNIVKSTAKAKIHIVVAGIAKVIPSLHDLSLMLPLLSLHTTGQSLTAINTVTFGPAQNSEGPEQMVVILLDNGRSDLLMNEKQRKMMSCIHCGACVSVCPVYKNIGGYAYDSGYVGPMGSVMTPLMQGLKENEHLTSACSLCGKCTDICPVKIPLNDLILENRHLVVSEKAGDAKLEAMFKLMIWHCKSRKKMDSPLFLKKMELRRFLNPAWGNRRTMPEFASKSFSQWWKEEKVG